MLRRILTLIVVGLLAFLSPTEEAPEVVPLLSGGDSNFINVVASGDITAGDDVIVGDDLTVGGDSALSGDLGVGGELTVDQDAYLNAGATIAGNPLTVTTSISNVGTLAQQGQSTFKSIAIFNGNLRTAYISDISNYAHLQFVNNGRTGTGNTSSTGHSLDAKEDFQVAGQLEVDQDTYLDAGATVAGNPLTVTTGVSNAGSYVGAEDLDVHGTGTFTDTLTAIGELQALSNITNSGAYVGVGDADVYGDVTVTGTTTLRDNLTFTGSGLGLQYGYVWGNEITWTQASAAQNTWYAVSDSGMTSGPLNGITHDGNGLITVTVAGMYAADWDGNFEADANGVHMQITFSIDGTPSEFGQNHIETVAANRDQSAGGTAILDLAAGQGVEVALRTTDAGTPNLFVDHLHIRLVQIGGT